jgi:hypothetical protein
MEGDTAKPSTPGTPLFLYLLSLSSEQVFNDPVKLNYQKRKEKRSKSVLTNDQAFSCHRLSEMFLCVEWRV